VLQDHLERRRRGDLEGDLDINYAEDLVVISKDGVFHGKDGIRRTAATLRSCLPEATYSYDIVGTAGEIGFLSWSARATDGSYTCDRTDTFVIRHGRIAAKTIDYDVEP
jgi:hypothetical protein